MNPSTQALFDRIKKATVALAVMHDRKSPVPSGEQPFTIVGSGFCIHEKGIIVSCRHVIEGFMEKKIKEQLASIPQEEKTKKVQVIGNVRAFIPHALFFIPLPSGHEVAAACVGVEVCVARTDLDVGLLRLGVHDAFPRGYPTVELEDFDNIHEGMDVATCGFPLGNWLFNQLGTVTSSFSRGIVSSIIPAAGMARQHVTGFQLDVRTTHGNSGGPVFSKHTGRVFGVLQGGISDQNGSFLFSRAEAIYPTMEDGSVNRILTMGHNPPT